MSEIIESAESFNGHTMMTVQTDRGDEYVIDADAAVKALADLFSDLDNEKRFGWNLSAPWYEQELQKLRAAVRQP